MTATDLARVLEDLAAFVRRYVVMPPAQTNAVALWVAHTHAFEAAESTPYLRVTSAEPVSGKTRLLEVLELVAARPLKTGGGAEGDAADDDDIDWDAARRIPSIGDPDYVDVLEAAYANGHLTDREAARRFRLHRAIARSME